MRLRVLFLTFFVVALIGCDKDEKDHCVESDCPEIIFNDQTPNLPPTYSILESSANDDNIKLKIGVSGCDLNRTFQLHVSSWIMKSLPPQRYAWLSFHDQPCEAYFQTELCFDRDLIEEETILHIITANDTVTVHLPASD